MEKERELTVSAMMDRFTTKTSKVQAGFCEFVVKPLIDTIAGAMNVGELSENLTYNIEKWKELS